jgi:solute:Na+ symporter, SSS family
MLATIDWVVIAAYLALSLGIGLWYTRQAGKSTADFFLGGRGLPWGLAGLSLVATTFAADTPLAVTELVRTQGVAGNWLWWNLLLGGMLTTFFFARLWRRSGVLTDVELVTIRYSGPAVPVLRGFKAIWQGVFLNGLIIGWVNLAMITILQVFFQMGFTEALLYTGALMLLTAGYSALSGLLGVVVTDAVQFVIAMAGCIVLAVIVLGLEQIGGLSGLVAKLPAESLDFFPRVGASSTPSVGTGAQLALGVGSFLAYATVQWWASWYPGAEPGGGGYVAQRMLAAKDERHSLWAVLLFQVMHYAVRPWPWIIVALATLILYPELGPGEARMAYLFAIRDVMPDGLRGLLLVAFLAAYMSTISTQLNFGTSYLVNDFYQPFIARGRSDAHYVWVARVATILLMLVGLAITTQLTSIEGAWRFLIECGAGTGLVLILRWYWWRVSAWSELAATLLPFLLYGFTQLMFHVVDGGAVDSMWQFPGSFFFTVGLTTLGWLVVTWLTPQTDAATLQAFSERVRPQGWWGAYAQPTDDQAPMSVLTICWLAGIALVLGVLFGTGALLFGRTGEGIGWLAQAALSIGVLGWLSRKYRVFA